MSVGKYVTHLLWCQESFKAAKLAYRQFKLRVRKTLSTSHFGPESLEDAAVDYIVRNLDLYDVQASVNVGQNPSLRYSNCYQKRVYLTVFHLPRM